MWHLIKKIRIPLFGDKTIKVRSIFGWSLIKTKDISAIHDLSIVHKYTIDSYNCYINRNKKKNTRSHLKNNNNIIPILEKCNNKDDKKKALILGWYGANNFGDDLMLHVIAKNKILSEYDISIIIDPNFTNFLNMEEEITLCYPPDKISDLEVISDYFDLIIIAGGAHIDDVEIHDLSFIPFLAIELSILAISKNKDVRWLSVSSNLILLNNKYLEKLKFVIEHSKQFSVRDVFSYNAIKRNGIQENLIIEKDLAFKFNYNKKLLIVTLIPFLKTEEYKNIIDEIIDFKNHSNSSWDVCLLPFFNGDNHDVNFYTKLLNEIGLREVENVFIGPCYNSIDSMIYFMKSGDLFFNMRYHASLISLIMKKPTISFCVDSHRHYLNKISSLTEMFPEHVLIKQSDYVIGDVKNKLLSLQGSFQK